MNDFWPARLQPVLATALFISVSILSLGVTANAYGEDEEIEERSEKSYGGFVWNQIEYDRILGGSEATTYAGAFILGTYLHPNLRTEFRAGVGATTDEVFVSTTPDAFGQRPYAEIGLDHYLSWYVGPQYLLTDYMGVYALLGFSRIISEVDYPEDQTVRPLEEELTDSSFSMSYLVGAEVKAYGDLWGFAEYGRLHRDTITEIRMWQLNVGLKYDF